MNCTKHPTVRLHVPGYSLDFWGYGFCPLCFARAGYSQERIKDMQNASLHKTAPAVPPLTSDTSPAGK